MNDDLKVKIRELEEMIEIVLISIPREISAREFYLNSIKKFRSGPAKELFTDLANQEKGHEAELRRILKRLRTELDEMKESK
ncbi:MAG: ferritin family protein [Acidobacteriota bacterium]